MRLPPALREFSRAWGEAPLHCAAGSSSPLPSLPGFSHLFQVSTCPWFPCQPMQIPHHSFTFSSLRQGFTDSLAHDGRIGNICFPQTFDSAVPKAFFSLSSRACLIHVKVCRDRFYPAGLVLSMGMPCWQPPGSSIYSIYNTSWCSDIHIKTFSNHSPEVCGARSAALPRLCHFQLNWEQLHTQPLHSRRSGAGPGRPQCWNSPRLGPGQGKVSGREERATHPSWQPQDLPLPARLSSQSSACATPRPLSYNPYQTLPGRRIISEYVILQSMILLLNQDNASIKNNIVITCSTMNKFCRAPEHISITQLWYF